MIVTIMCALFHIDFQKAERRYTVTEQEFFRVT